MDEEQIAEDILQCCRFLHARQLLAAADGNVSHRLDDRRILITPAGRHKAMLRREELAVIDEDGNVIRGEPSTERALHLEVYRRCAKARCVVHAHPPTAIAWTVARPSLQAMPETALPEVILGTGSIPIVPYARPGTDAMARSIAPYLPQSRVLLLARHGAVCWGESLVEAYNGMERLEHVALILRTAEALGGISPLPEDEVKALKQLRAQKGETIL